MWEMQIKTIVLYTFRFCISLFTALASWYLSQQRTAAISQNFVQNRNFSPEQLSPDKLMSQSSFTEFERKNCSFESLSASSQFHSWRRR